eukprot:1181416-Prorocentrum_minimum.AAC.1
MCRPPPRRLVRRCGRRHTRWPPRRGRRGPPGGAAGTWRPWIGRPVPADRTCPAPRCTHAPPCPTPNCAKMTEIIKRTETHTSYLIASNPHMVGLCGDPKVAVTHLWLSPHATCTIPTAQSRSNRSGTYAPPSPASRPSAPNVPVERGAQGGRTASPLEITRRGGRRWRALRCAQLPPPPLRTGPPSPRAPTAGAARPHPRPRRARAARTLPPPTRPGHPGHIGIGVANAPVVLVGCVSCALLCTVVTVFTVVTVVPVVQWYSGTVVTVVY